MTAACRCKQGCTGCNGCNGRACTTIRAFTYPTCLGLLAPEAAFRTTSGFSHQIACTWQRTESDFTIDTPGQAGRSNRQASSGPVHVSATWNGHVITVCPRIGDAGANQQQLLCQRSGLLSHRQPPWGLTCKSASGNAPVRKAAAARGRAWSNQQPLFHLTSTSCPRPCCCSTGAPAREAAQPHQQPVKYLASRSASEQAPLSTTPAA